MAKRTKKAGGGKGRGKASGKSKTGTSGKATKRSTASTSGKTSGRSKAGTAGKAKKSSTAGSSAKASGRSKAGTAGKALEGGRKKAMTDDSDTNLSIAERLGRQQKDISVAEFFERNKHILGFDSPTRAVLTAVKEGLDNSLDACEDAEILPDIYIALHKLPRRDEFLLTVEDNGPGIVGENLAQVYGKLLYGSRFHVIRQSRGQQGIGISAVVMYGQLSTGHPSLIRSKVAENDGAWYQEIKLDTKKNKPDVSRRESFIWKEKTSGKARERVAAGAADGSGGSVPATDWFAALQLREASRKPYPLEPFKEKLLDGFLSYTLAFGEEHKLTEGAAPRHRVLEFEKEHGVRLSIAFQGRYVRGRQSALEYIRATSIINPHARIVFEEPDGTTNVFERVSEKLPKPTTEIKPHPQGIELGTLLKMAKETASYKLTAFLEREFVSISPRRAKHICDVAGLDYGLKPKKIGLHEARELIEAFQKVKIMAPPTDCLSPIGDLLIKKGLKKEIDSKFAFTTTRAPAVYSGNPFQVEAGLVYGGDLKPDDSLGILRFANRVPLLYQQGGCVVTHAVESIDWRNYGLEQRGGRGIPHGPAMLLIHLSSTNVPFTSESKEAIADIPAIQAEVELALRECARKLKTHINKRKKLKKTKEKFELIQEVLPAIARKSAEIVGKKTPSIDAVVSKIMNIVFVEQSITCEPVPASGGGADGDTGGEGGAGGRSGKDGKGGSGGKGGKADKGEKTKTGAAAAKGKGGKGAKAGATTLDSFVGDDAAAASGGGGAEGGEGTTTEGSRQGNGLPPGTGVLVLDSGKRLPKGVVIPSSRWATQVTVRVSNYTPKQKNMTLAIKLGDVAVRHVEPKPKQVKDGLLLWDFDKVRSSQRVEVSFEVVGLDKGDLDEVEVFYKRITGEVIGAESL